MTQYNEGNARSGHFWLEEMMSFRSGSRILRRVEEASYLAKGAFAVVFRARMRDGGEPCVLKYIPRPMTSAEAAPRGSEQDNVNAADFDQSRAEARVLALFDNVPCVVHALEEPEFLTRDIRGEGGVVSRQYAVLIRMPLYRDSRQWMPEVAASREDRLRVGIDIATALMAFERRGVIHRDIKPENILRGQDGGFFLSDVGEAKLESDASTMSAHGTLGYLAPEVYKLTLERSRTLSDHRSDIYSLGIVLYRLFSYQQFPFLDQTGRLSTQGKHSLERYRKRMDLAGRAPSDRELAGRLRYGGIALPQPMDADEALSAIILKACAYSVKSRYQKAQELRDALVEYRDGAFELEAEHTLRAPRDTPPPVNPHRKSRAERTRRQKRARLGPLVGAGAAASILLAGGLIVWLSSPRVNAPTATQTPAASAPALPAAPTAVAVLAPTRTPAPVPTATPTPTATATPSLSPSPTPTATPSPSPTPMPTPPPSPTATRSPSPTSTPSPSPTPSATPSPTPAPTATSTPSLENYRLGYELHAGEMASFSKKQNIPVYTGPGKNYFRGAKGKASVGTGDWVLCYGWDNGCYLIEYEVNSDRNRVGYIRPEDIRGNYVVNETALPNARLAVRFARDASLTDDPFRSGTSFCDVPSGTEATAFFFAGDYVFVELHHGRVGLARGFAPLSALRLKDENSETGGK